MRGENYPNPSCALTSINVGITIASDRSDPAAVASRCCTDVACRRYESPHRGDRRRLQLLWL